MRDEPAASIVSLQSVGKVFPNGVVALRDASFSVRDGEFVSLLGPSGCGKSTALRIIAGLIAPSSGTVTWSKAESAPLRAGDVGFVFQEPTLMPWTTVVGNIYLPLKLAGMDRRAAMPRVMAMLEQVGLAGFEEAYPRELSGGMKMRVSIARALVTEPRVLLLDEPFAALDEITRFRLNNDLLALWRSMRQTVIFVTHSVFESVYLSGRILVMTARPGRIHGDIAVDVPYPRDEAFRTSAEYAALCRTVSQTLTAAMATQDAA